MRKLTSLFVMPAIIGALLLSPVSPAHADFFRGDSSADGVINLVDAIFSLNYLAVGGQAPSCLDAADADDNGQVNVVDPVYTLAFLFGAGAKGKRKSLPNARIMIHQPLGGAQGQAADIEIQ